MTHSGGKPHEVGDRGQRYEISYLVLNINERKVFGWSGTREGAYERAKLCDRHPGWGAACVRDRGEVPQPEKPA